MPTVYNVSDQPIVHAYGEGLVTPGEGYETDAPGTPTYPWSLDPALAQQAAVAYHAAHGTPLPTAAVATPSVASAPDQPPEAAPVESPAPAVEPAAEPVAPEESEPAAETEPPTPPSADTPQEA